MKDSVVWAYGRVSSESQKLDRQIEAFHEYGIDDRHIKLEKKSGKDFNRPEFLSLVGTESVAPCMREGDSLVIVSLDRLGRNYSEICYWWKHITVDMKCSIIVLDMPLFNNLGSDSSLDKRFIADLVLQILGYVSEKERIHIKERQREGIAVAKAQGTKFGRPVIEKPENFQIIYSDWKEKKITTIEAARLLNVCKNTFYKFVKEEQL